MEKITLDGLNQDSASLLKIIYTTVNGQEIEVSRCRTAYCNSPIGRTTVQAEVSEPYKTAIFTVWGDTATVADVAQ